MPVIIGDNKDVQFMQPPGSAAGGGFQFPVDRRFSLGSSDGTSSGRNSAASSSSSSARAHAENAMQMQQQQHGYQGSVSSRFSFSPI